jgi:hypothetical protein
MSFSGTCNQYVRMYACMCVCPCHLHFWNIQVIISLIDNTAMMMHVVEMAIAPWSTVVTVGTIEYMVHYYFCFMTVLILLLHGSLGLLVTNYHVLPGCHGLFFSPSISAQGECFLKHRNCNCNCKHPAWLPISTACRYVPALPLHSEPEQSSVLSTPWKWCV